MRRIKELRDEAGLSQAQLSLATNIPQTTISAIERSAINPTVNVVRRLADYFGCTIDDLLTPREPDGADTS